MKQLNRYCILLLVVLCLGINKVKCLFEDQAGTYDWRQQHIGKPLFSHIDYSTRKFYIASDQNLLGALNIKTGNIVWRKIFESNDLGKIDHVLFGTNEIVVITGNGHRVQSFNYNNGFANWEYILFNKNEIFDKQFSAIESKREKETFYMTDGKQICHAGFKEKICVDLPISEGYVYKHLYENSKGVFVIGFKENSVKQIQFSFSLSSIVAKSVSPQNGDLKWLKSETKCLKLVDGDQLVCYSNEENKLVVQKPDNQIVFEEYDLPNNLAKNIKLVWASKNKLVFEQNEKTLLSKDDVQSISLLIMKINQENKLSIGSNIDSIVNYSFEKKNEENFVVYAKYNNQDLMFTTSSLTNEDKSNHVVNVVSNNKGEPNAILKLSANLVETKGGQFGVLTFCFFNDYTMSIFSTQGARYFTREEALAYISSVEMVDFPQSHLQEELEEEFDTSQDINIISMFFKRIRTQIVQLREFVQTDLYQKLITFINNNNPNKRTSSTKPQNTIFSVDDITRDEFNLNKIVVVATSVGKVYGIYTSANGKILWSFFLKNTLPFQVNKFSEKKSVSLFLQRTSAHVTHEPRAVFVSKYVSEKSLVYFFNPLTGEAAKDYTNEPFILDYTVKQTFLSPSADSNFLKPLVIFDDKNKLHVFPETGIDIFKTSGKLNVIYTADIHENGKDSVLIGHAMSYSNEPLSELWRINIEDEVIQSIGSLRSNDRIHSIGKVVGDRSVLYKYLNPNLIGVVSTGKDNQNIEFINVYLIDTVTGAIVNSFNHKKCRGPVNIVHSENWFFYSYYDIKNRRYEVTSVELFEGSQRFNATSFSSFDDIKPIFYSKSYVVQKAFSSMQVTLTERGIATKDVIVACKSGVIIDIPWVLIDPRRPMKMTEVEKEEQLLPYMPEIPLNYEFSLNYYNYVYNVRGITTAASGLESTSLVFVYGLDIYFTRVFPSKTFDLLREDFDYLFVSTLMFGLLIGTFLCKKLASSSNLKKAWK
jgi:hypothetical protein